ncbi:hypothetical protein [Thalassobacillus hwangdonensis]|uniref:Uncharacterized protein n=1 Tax=Thalassobacillus hwangdonensis TaxID=546108 RepID=A0ABW3L258_9BACI
MLHSGDTTVDLVALISFVVIFYLLLRWGHRYKGNTIKIFVYYFISMYIGVLFSHSSEGDVFTLWFPYGFAAALIYLFTSGQYHPSKMKASIVGLMYGGYSLAIEEGFLDLPHIYL